MNILIYTLTSLFWTFYILQRSCNTQTEVIVFKISHGQGKASYFYVLNSVTKTFQEALGPWIKLFQSMLWRCVRGTSVCDIKLLVWVFSCDVYIAGKCITQHVDINTILKILSKGLYLLVLLFQKVTLGIDWSAFRQDYW